MTNAEKKIVAGEILNGLAQIADRPKDPKGNLDVKAFNELPEVRKAIKRFKQVGITRKWLFKNGFQIAGLVLTFGINEEERLNEIDKKVDSMEK
jgi:hypothetical protein